MGISRARGSQDAHSRDCKVGPMSVKGRAVEGRTPMQAGVIRPMANRGDSEAADRTCGELRGVSDRPFGGALAVGVGDFKQMAPVVPEALASQHRFCGGRGQGGHQNSSSSGSTCSMTTACPITISNSRSADADAEFVGRRRAVVRSVGQNAITIEPRACFGATNEGQGSGDGGHARATGTRRSRVRGGAERF